MLKLFDKDVRTANLLLAHSEAEKKALRKSLDAEEARKKSTGSSSGDCEEARKKSTGSSSRGSATSSSRRTSTSSEESTANPSDRSVSSCTTGEEDLDVDLATADTMRRILKKRQDRRRERLEQYANRPEKEQRLPPRPPSLAEPEPDPAAEDLSIVEGSSMPPLPLASSKGLGTAPVDDPLAQAKDSTAAPSTVYAALNGFDGLFSGFKARSCTWTTAAERQERGGRRQGRVTLRKRSSDGNSCGIYWWPW